MSYDRYNSHQPRQSSVHLTSYDEDSKASYDDLIDEYASPYGANSRHQTVDFSHRRGPSFPLSQKMQSKQSEDTSMDHSNMDYPPPVVQPVAAPSFWRRLIPDTLACRLYLLVLLIETIIDVAAEADLLVRVLEQNRFVDDSSAEDKEKTDIVTRKITIYLILFSIAHMSSQNLLRLLGKSLLVSVFQLVMALDAVYHRNTLQFICLTIFNGALLLYSIVQIGEVNESIETTSSGISKIPINVLTILIPCVIGVSTLAYCALGYRIYQEFGWQVYKFLGADRRIKKMYAHYQVYECLIKFDVFFWAGFSIQFICLVLDDNDWEFWVTVAALPVSLLLLWEGHLAARHEGKWMMASFMTGCVGAMVYFCYKLIKVLMRWKDDYVYTWKSLTIFSGIAILLLILTFVYAILTMRNFGRGLKDSLSRKNVPETSWTNNPNGPANKIINRMSIN